MTWSEQTWASDPGAQIDWFADLPGDPTALRALARGLVLHYRSPDAESLGLGAERWGEIHTREVELILARLRELADGPISRQRAVTERILGCCRDFSVLFVSMARHLGLRARTRVGFGTYFVPGYALDHEVAELWDPARGRWRLIDSQLDESHVDPHDGAPINGLDVDRARFLTGGRAWLACRAGQDDPDRFVVAPGLGAPELQGWRYLAHNLVHDLARLRGDEFLLWESWGVLEDPEIATHHADLLDRLAEVIAGSDIDLLTVTSILAEEPGLSAPSRVRRYDPLGGPPIEVGVPRRG